MGIKVIKINSQEYTTQEGIKEIKNITLVYTTQEGTAEIKKPLGKHYPRGYKTD